MVETKRRPIYRYWWFWLLAGILMFFLGYLVGLSFTPGGRINPLELFLISDLHSTPLNFSDALDIARSSHA